ncbi:hypothetical protein [Enterococcus gilvus]|uniref:hypothetical protein n=1 Tax=Enterococcus gilvus TaxID=160453 RepID=UPI0028D719CD|nr:hypothetical protein [Enterococcus gilvus]
MKVQTKGHSNRKRFRQIGQKEERSILDLFPYKRCSEEGVLVTEEDHLQRFFRIASTDVEGLNEQEQVERMNQLTMVMRTYVPGIKLTTLTTQTDLSAQIAEKRRLLQKNRLAQTQSSGATLTIFRKYERILVEEIEELKRSEKEKPDLTFFFVIEAKTPKELLIRSRQLLRVSGVLELKPQNKTNLITILYRMSNMNEE